MVAGLTPGEGLSELNRRVVEGVAGTLNAVDESEGGRGLYRWIRDSLTLATADALYGVESPLNKDRGLIDALWYVVCYSPMHEPYTPNFLTSHVL